jgi:hypothetical protein
MSQVYEVLTRFRSMLNMSEITEARSYDALFAHTWQTAVDGSNRLTDPEDHVTRAFHLGVKVGLGLWAKTIIHAFKVQLFPEKEFQEFLAVKGLTDPDGKLHEAYFAAMQTKYKYVAALKRLILDQQKLARICLDRVADLKLDDETLQQVENETLTEYE